MRAVVVGGGIGGLGAAIALERAGVEPIVIERAPELREAGFGLVVSANAVTALRALGLHEGVAARGSRVRRAEIRNPRGDLLTLIDYEALGWETYGILRSDLQRAMLEAVPGDHLHLGTTCLGGTDDGQTLLDGAKPVVADIVDSRLTRTPSVREEVPLVKAISSPSSHFAAWQEPEFFATEIRAAFRSLR